MKKPSMEQIEKAANAASLIIGGITIAIRIISMFAGKGKAS